MYIFFCGFLFYFSGGSRLSDKEGGGGVLQIIFFAPLYLTVVQK